MPPVNYPPRHPGIQPLPFLPGIKRKKAKVGEIKVDGTISRLAKLKDERKEREKEFREKSGWSFDPTKFGFSVVKKHRHSLLHARYDKDDYQWYAEKVVRKKPARRSSTLSEEIVTFHIRRHDATSHHYVVRKIFTSRIYSLDVPFKIWDCTLPNEAIARKALIELEAFTPDSFRIEA